MAFRITAIGNQNLFDKNSPKEVDKHRRLAPCGLAEGMKTNQPMARPVARAVEGGTTEGRT